jgi:Ca2+/Na+ antiporter
MSKMQKIALFNLSLSSVGLMFQLLCFLASNIPIRLIASILALILCCFLAVSYIFRSQVARQSGVYDERDKSIHKTGALVGFATFFFVLFSAGVISLFFLGSGHSIFEVFMPAALSLFFAESVAVLIQYGCGGHDGEK